MLPHYIRSRATLAAALDVDLPLLVQAIAVLRAWPVPEYIDPFVDQDPALLSVGTADRALLAVHEEVLGYPLEYTAACPACDELTTLPLARADVGEHAPADAWCRPGMGVREPTYADILAVDGDLESLLRRCLAGPSAGLANLETGSADFKARLADLARIEGSLSGPLHSTCAGCGAPLILNVDVVELVIASLWKVCEEIDQEVHVLATAYGWDLTSIESLPDERRRRLAGLVLSERQ